MVKQTAGRDQLGDFASKSQGLVDSSFQYHLMRAKNNGITKAEIAEILTHAAFYAGWPKAWAAFKMAKDVWVEESPKGNEMACSFFAGVII